MNRWIGAPVLLGSLALGLAACGGSSGSGSASSGGSDNGEAAKSVSQIGHDVEAAMKGLKSFHISGSVTDSGQTIGLDLAVENSGPGGGTMSINGSSFQLVVNGSKLYFKGDQAFWEKTGGVNASVANLFAGKWVTGVPSTSDLQSLAQLTNINSFVSGLSSGSDSGPNGTKQSVTTFHGQSALPIKSTDGTVYVATSGPPYLLGLQGGSQGTLTFDQFNSATAPAVPTGAVDFGDLSGGS
ncbi:MAG TPA: hypothetical protein VFW24_13975 [Acidimicrobiales bacterium]|nr:hypothetical protein [Acidimicrobiales bacterium]